LTCLVSSLYKKFRINPTFEFISILVIPKDTDMVFENLLGKCNIMLRGNEHIIILLCLKNISIIIDLYLHLFFEYCKYSLIELSKPIFYFIS